MYHKDMIKRIIPIILAGILLLTACGSKKGIEIRNAWARPAAQGGNGAIYFELYNHGSASDELTGVSFDAAEAAEIHESKMEGDVMKMQMISSLPIDGSADIAFKPGGLHIMLISLKQELKSGDEFEIVLHFKDHEDITVHVLVRDSAPKEGHNM